MGETCFLGTFGPSVPEPESGAIPESGPLEQDSGRISGRGLSPEEEYAAAGSDNYRGVYFRSNGNLRKFAEQIVVHHRIPREVLKNYPGRFTLEEIMAPENLEGIPKELAEEGIGERSLTHVDVTNDWNNFFVSRPNATREEIEGFANMMDEKYGLRTLAYDYFHVQR